jgi:hypothetical protein
MSTHAFDANRLKAALLSTAVALSAASIAAFAWPAFSQTPAAAGVQADAPPAQPTLQQIVAQQIQLRGQVAGKRGAFKDISESDRERLLKQQNRLLALLEGRNSIDALRPEERVEVFNVLQEVNAAVTKAEDERKICERTRLTGSHRFQVVCMTAKEYREHKDDAQKSLRTPVKCQGVQKGDNTCGFQ